MTTTIACKEAHPHPTCAEYGQWQEWVEQAGGDVYATDLAQDVLWRAFRPVPGRVPPAERRRNGL